MAVVPQIEWLFFTANISGEKFLIISSKYVSMKAQSIFSVFAAHTAILLNLQCVLIGISNWFCITSYKLTTPTAQIFTRWYPVTLIALITHLIAPIMLSVSVNVR